MKVGVLLPASAIGVSVQEVGRIDIVLRAMEDERRQVGIGNIMPGDPMAFGTQATFSRLWVALAYEIVRLLRERMLLPQSEAAVALMDGLEGVRVPLMKHEIQQNKKLKEQILMGYVNPQGEVTPGYTYDPQDKRRAHIMPSGITPRGSLTWLMFDHRTGREQWMERLYLSELMFSIA